MTNIRWKSLNRPDLGIANRISALFARRAWSAPDCLPRFRDTKQLIIACDYSGDAKQYNFRSQTFLMVDGGALWHWDRLRLRLRADCFKEPRRISFKNVTERQRAAALVPFLRAANTLPGVLFTLLVDKRIGSVFQADDKLDDYGASLWRRLEPVDVRSRERLFLLAHSVGLLLSGFSSAGQDVLIISDEDAMFANDQRHRLACELLACVGSHYLTHTLGRLQVCTTRSDTGRLDLEDLAAIPDLEGQSFLLLDQTVGNDHVHVALMRVLDCVIHQVHQRQTQRLRSRLDRIRARRLVYDLEFKPLFQSPLATERIDLVQQ